MAFMLISDEFEETKVGTRKHDGNETHYLAGDYLPLPGL